MIELLSKALRI
jgi:hypothetical protein